MAGSWALRGCLDLYRRLAGRQVVAVAQEFRANIQVDSNLGPRDLLVAAVGKDHVMGWNDFDDCGVGDLRFREIVD